MAEDNDRPRDASSASDHPGFDGLSADLVIPDDIRELSADIAAYHRELRHDRRLLLAHRLVSPRRSGPLLAVMIASLVAGLIALMLTVMGPGVVDRPLTAAPLAHPSAADGTLGGLLPEAILNGPIGTVDTRSSTMRPAVYALIPQGCDCRTLLDGLAGDAFSERLPLAVVVPAASDPATAAIVSSLDRGLSALYLDPSATLASVITGSVPTVAGSRAATVVVVNRDGTIYDIERGVTNARATSLDAALQSMLVAG